MPSRPLEPGDPVRLGRFELFGRLGEGGQGVVYLGRGTNPGEERVAVKVLRSTVDANVLERLARELDARITRLTQHWWDGIECHPDKPNRCKPRTRVTVWPLNG